MVPLRLVLVFRHFNSRDFLRNARDQLSHAFRIAEDLRQLRRRIVDQDIAFEDAQGNASLEFHL